MRATLLLPVLLAGALCASDVFAQPTRGPINGGRPPIVQGQFGFNINDGTTNAGTLCSGFTCTAATLSPSAGATLTFGIRAPRNAKYFLIVGPSPSLCVTFPGFGNKWIVPVSIVIPGVVNQVDRGPRCFGYMSSFTANIPRGTPKGTRAAFQVLAELPTASNTKQAAFSSAINISTK